MTDNERSRIEAICEVANVNDIEDLSDGFHTFGQLYYQRMMLFATIVKQNRDRAWKSLRHEDGELCFGGGWFIVGIDTPEGSYTYHYENKYFDFFDCEILDYGKHWDGHTEKDVTRLLSLPADVQPVRWIPCSERLPEEHESIWAKAKGTDRWSEAMWEKQSDEVIVTELFEDGTTRTDTACTHDGEWYMGVKIVNRKIIAWMPLPEPWKGADNE